MLEMIGNCTAKHTEWYLQVSVQTKRCYNVIKQNTFMKIKKQTC